MNIPDQLPKLKGGLGAPGSNEVCAEQAINWLVSGRIDLGEETDHPKCVQPVLNSLAIVVNDSISDSRRGEMWPILLRQPGTAHPEMEPVLSVRLAAFLAEKVLHLVRPGDWQVCRDAITAAQVWCDNPNQEAAAKAAAYAASASAAYAYAAYAYAASAAYAAYAAYAYAAYAYAASAAAAYAAYDTYAEISKRDDALLEILRDAQDECERLTGHIPQACDLKRLERLGELVGY
jgi:hypothetical protein